MKENCFAKWINPLKAVRRAHDSYELACRELAEVTKEALPCGTIIEASLGRSRITGVIVDHPQWWGTYVGSVYVRNLKTGKVRRVEPYSGRQEVRVISLPKE